MPTAGLAWLQLTHKVFYDIPNDLTLGKARLTHSVKTEWIFRMGSFLRQYSAVQFPLCRIALPGAPLENIMLFFRPQPVRQIFPPSDNDNNQSTRLLPQSE